MSDNYRQAECRACKKWKRVRWATCDECVQKWLRKEKAYRDSLQRCPLCHRLEFFDQDCCDSCDALIGLGPLQTKPETFRATREENQDAVHEGEVHLRVGST